MHPRLRWPDADVRVTSKMRVDVVQEGYHVFIEADAYDGEDRLSHREWAETFPR